VIGDPNGHLAPNAIAEIEVDEFDVDKGESAQLP